MNRPSNSRKRNRNMPPPQRVPLGTISGNPPQKSWRYWGRKQEEQVPKPGGLQAFVAVAEAREEAREEGGRQVNLSA